MYVIHKTRIWCWWIGALIWGLRVRVSNSTLQNTTKKYFIKKVLSQKTNTTNCKFKYTNIRCCALFYSPVMVVIRHNPMSIISYSAMKRVWFAVPTFYRNKIYPRVIDIEQQTVITSRIRYTKERLIELWPGSIYFLTRFIYKNITWSIFSESFNNLYKFVLSGISREQSSSKGSCCFCTHVIASMWVIIVTTLNDNLCLLSGC